jgi:hypothetical protein
MKPSEIKALFPKTVEITEEILSGANLRDGNRCIGALALKSFIPKEEHDRIFWGLYIGSVSGVFLKTEEWDSEEKMFLPLYVNEIKKPQSITFTLRKTNG